MQPKVQPPDPAFPKLKHQPLQFWCLTCQEWHKDPALVFEHARKASKQQ